ncbi:ATP-binding protein [Candidatus Rhodobacter oscarellae]|uniref:ATP-binding protein n=1 Tax=Candidatus Rhodobacter oscarellae TaxID=1675527 RepID=UPI0006717CCC|nr:ATP-binding protein [Candidatus Rhodobacter lobularis]
MGFDVLVGVCLGYVAILFAVAFAAEQRAQRAEVNWLRSPLIYTLSLSIYCTAWTFYGAVGYAVRSGLEFVTIYLGPTLVMIGWWWVVRKLVRIGRTQRITSIADLISSRYGKSNLLGVVVTVLAVVGTTPYIALQLQSVTLSFAVLAADEGTTLNPEDLQTTALIVAAGLAFFTILFGTRRLDTNERHPGVVTAIALEAAVKLIALLAVGIFVVWGVASGPADILARTEASRIAAWQPDGARWATLIFLAAAAFLCLPRMFQVMVVENADERHVAVASWAFPGYLFLMSLFVVPIAVVGLQTLPEGNPDLYVLTLPLALGEERLALLAFLGGFSSATSMVIVAAIALSTMVSNHIVMPIWLRAGDPGAVVSGDVRQVVMVSRRVSIGAILALGYLYFLFTGGTGALAAIGLIAFAGLAQVLPAMLGGIFWRGATRVGAAAGLILGFSVWAYTLFLPSFGGTFIMSETFLAQGPFGIAALRPQALLGMEGIDPLVHAVLWSILLNTAAFIVGSLFSFPRPLERLQGAQFVNVFEHSANPRGWSGGAAEAEDLLIMSQRILGSKEAQALFRTAAAVQGKSGDYADITPEFLETLERELASSVGAATAHAMISQIVGGSAVSMEDLLAVADETAQIMEYSLRLQEQSQELERTATQLREANEKLTALSIQKDAFLSQISHELRTPMTSIRAFSEILMAGSTQEAEQSRFSSIIHDEAKRLTRLLDDLLDLSVLENGQVTLNWQDADLHDILERAVAATTSMEGQPRLNVLRDPDAESIAFTTDADRLSQVFINLITNAQKYCTAEAPELRISVTQAGDGGGVHVDFVDNGAGIPRESEAVIFEKFSRLSDKSQAGGAGLGLAICREIMGKLGGSISYQPSEAGTAFRVILPQREAQAAE